MFAEIDNVGKSKTAFAKNSIKFNDFAELLRLRKPPLLRLFDRR